MAAMKRFKRLVKALRRMSRGEQVLPFVSLFQPYRERESSYLVLKRPRPAPAATVRDLPLPPHHLLVGNMDNERYLAWGEEHYSNMARILAASGQPIASGQRVLDFGCGSGRMIRWLFPMAHASEVWGVDLSTEHVFWCQQNLQPPFRFAVTTIVPHLPFEGGYFDLVYAGSVFTHIDDLTTSWLLELRRILKPGGRLYVTIHDGESIKALQTDLRGQPNFPYATSPEFEAYAQQDYACFTLGRSEGSQVFYDRGYFCEMAGSMFRVLATEGHAYGHQTAVLLQKVGAGQAG
jgi:SAM-dependent methyltransferase